MILSSIIVQVLSNHHASFLILSLIISAAFPILSCLQVSPPLSPKRISSLHIFSPAFLFSFFITSNYLYLALCCPHRLSLPAFPTSFPLYRSFSSPLRLLACLASLLVSCHRAPVRRLFSSSLPTLALPSLPILFSVFTFYSLALLFSSL